MTTSGSLSFQVLDHTDEQEAERIRQLFFDSYSVEARIIGVRDFPPLRRTRAEILDSDAVFHGTFMIDRLSSVAELEHSRDGIINIAGFAVHPELFRRGIGARFLEHLIQGSAGYTMTVSTAIANGPAISLYQKSGFSICQTWKTPCGIEMVTLERR